MDSSSPPVDSRHPLQWKIDAKRNQALLSSSSTRPRQPAPYPEGEILSHINHRYIVRHGSHVTKYTTFPGGMGANDHPNEAEALRFVRANTTIPVPSVVSSDWDRLTMEYIEGQTLRDAWPELTDQQRGEIRDQLANYIAQLRALPGVYVGRLDGQGAVVPNIVPRSGGPFETVCQFHEWLARPPGYPEQQALFWQECTETMQSEYPVVFTHGDIASRNILVRDGRVVALLDWEFAGWYPAYWEYVFALRGLDNLDWETMGSHVRSFFPERYNMEYIIIRFFLTLS